MNSSVKLALYILLAVLAGISGYYALANFGRLMERSGERHSALEQIEPERPIPADTAPAETNAAAAGKTNSVASTNAAGAVTNLAATNAAGTNVASGPGAGESEAVPAAGAIATDGAKPKTTGRLGLWTGLFILSLVGLGLLIASDVSHFFGNKALKTLYNEEGEGVANPDYEKAEEVWAKGQHLEAISLMREYLNRNPREQHVAIRIAEIYEKDLKNHLAAALEYEEVLKHKLPPDRWGWSAIHLCNLYFKLNQEAKAYPLLRRIVNEYPQTPAADKARKRLEQVGEMEGDLSPIQPGSAQAAPATPAAPEPPSNLPPGFRPKK